MVCLSTGFVKELPTTWNSMALFCSSALTFSSRDTLTGNRISVLFMAFDSEMALSARSTVSSERSSYVESLEEKGI